MSKELLDVIRIYIKKENERQLPKLESLKARMKMSIDKMDLEELPESVLKFIGYIKEMKEINSCVDKTEYMPESFIKDLKEFVHSTGLIDKIK